MKKVFIVHYSMDIGGAESSLLGLLQSFDYTRYDVYLMLLWPRGELLSLIPQEVHLFDTPREYLNLVLPIKSVIKCGGFAIAGARILGKIAARKYKSNTYAIKQYSHAFTLPFLPEIPGKYDMAISFIDPHYIVANKVSANVKLAWMHTDFSKIETNFEKDRKMWEPYNYIVNVSDSCKKAFDEVYPFLKDKSVVLENILSKKFMYSQAKMASVEQEMKSDGIIRLLTVGRYAPAKNFDNIPYICKSIVELGVEVKWYIIGYGSVEAEKEIRQNIEFAGMKDRVILLGKKENPYPYLYACDVYVQPSRYEGKSVAVREAQIFCKPVIITNYATSASQLKNGYDGVIVPMDNEACASGIVAIIQDKELLHKLIENTKKNDYTNATEVEKLYRMMED